MTGGHGAQPSVARVVHDLKCWPMFFGDVARQSKTFEVRRDDRDFRVGDVLRLREWSALDGYSGNEVLREVTYVLTGGQFGVEDGYCVMALIAVPEGLLL